MLEPTPPSFRPRRPFWVILAILGAYLTGLPALFAIPAERILFNADEYKRALAEQDVYDRFPTMLGEMVSEGGNKLIPGTGTAVLNMLEKSRYDAVIQELFPVSWVRDQAESLIDQFWAFLNFETPELALKVDLRPVKSHLGGEGAPEVASIIVEGLPPCTAEDLFTFALQALQGTAEGLPLCKPPDQFLNLTNNLVGGLLAGTSSTMPDEIDLASGLRFASTLGGERVEGAASRWFGVYRFFRQVNPWLPYAAAGFALLAIGLSTRTRRGPLFWGGVTLVLPGLSALAIALLFGLWLAQFVPVLVGAVFGADMVLFDTLVDVIETVMRRFIGSVLLWSAVVGLLGVALIGMWYGWQRKKEAAE